MKVILTILTLIIVCLSSSFAEVAGKQASGYDPMEATRFHELYIRFNDQKVIIDTFESKPTSPIPVIPRVDPKPRIVVKSTGGNWSSAEASWYGPGFYGNGTACGQTYTKTIIGVAHKSLKCGTKVIFRYKGREVIARVIDRGPYVAGRLWDLSHGLCMALDHCFTGVIKYRIVR